VKQYGLVEYLSSYAGMGMQVIEQALMHCASNTLMTSYNQLYQFYFADLMLHYHPGSNSFGGPSARSYDMSTGTVSEVHKIMHEVPHPLPSWSSFSALAIFRRC
jgi:hypothetical protein